MDADRPETFHAAPSLTRRGFVRSAAAAIALPVLAGTAVPRRARGAGTDEIRVGLIGCGGRGTGAAVQALAADPGAVLTAMGDAFEDRLLGSLSAITEHLGEEGASKLRVGPEARFVGFDAYQKVIDSGVDVVLLTAYPHFRPRHFAAAVAAGKHVFCEKPMAVDAPGLRTVLAAAREAKANGLSVVSGFCWRYADAERAAFEQVHAGAVGDVVTVHTTYHTTTLGQRPRQPSWSDLEWQMRNWWHFAWLSGDHIVEQACHSIDRLAWAMKDVPPVRCNALGGRQARSGPESGNVYDHFAVVYEYADGRRGFHTCRQIDGCPSDNSDYIYGARGWCELNGGKPVHAVRNPSGRTIWSYEGPRRDMYQNEHDALFASIRAGAALNDGEWMCNSTMMALMARMAAYTGQTITWERAWESREDYTPEGGRYEFGPLAVAPVAVPGRTKFV